MGWREQLQKASFRGVAFEVESDDATFGRRVETHEYPQRDIPYVEDLGRKARERNLTGFVIGDDYMAKRDALLGALEKAGAGELVHPYYGRMTVSVTDVRVSHSFRDGGMCSFQISFIESGELSFPAAVNSTSTQSLQAADVLEASCIADFTEKFSIENLPDFAVQDALASFNGALDTLDGALSRTGVLLDNPLSLLQGDMTNLIRTPASLASRFFGIFSKGESVLSAVSGLGDINALNMLNVLTGIRLTNLFASSNVTGSTPTRVAMARNQQAINTMMRQSLITQATGMVAAMPLPIYDDAIVVKNELLTVIDTELQMANDTNYLALKNVRTKTHADVTARTQGAARLKNITPKEVTPALVLAYDLYEDTTRDAEIINRNKVRHPGFVPANVLKVLSA
ncbi:MAG: DNA circularization N-terminal domain-containing protein [Methylotenera sp.]|nr:DNA circularization N-terminal domain-containing protein [Methylotenera sp.]